MKNYYQILGLDFKASDDEIKKAYRYYASKFHPDKHQGDKFFEERFKELLEAYEILSDANKKAVYDKKFGFEKDRVFNNNQDIKTEQKTTTTETKQEQNYSNIKTDQKEAKNNEPVNTNKQTPIKNIGMFIFWGGILIGILLAANGKEETALAMIWSMNIGGWLGGALWLIGAKLKI